MPSFRTCRCPTLVSLLPVFGEQVHLRKNNTRIFFTNLTVDVSRILNVSEFSYESYLKCFREHVISGTSSMTFATKAGLPVCNIDLLVLSSLKVRHELYFQRTGALRAPRSLSRH